MAGPPAVLVVDSQVRCVVSAYYNVFTIGTLAVRRSIPKTRGYEGFVVHSLAHIPTHFRSVQRFSDRLIRLHSLVELALSLSSSKRGQQS